MTSQQSAAVEPRRQAILVAFVSADDAVDRAGAIANLACLLASNDRSVLVLDLPEAVYRVAEYLAPFAAEQGALRELAGAKLEREYAITFSWTSPRDSTLDRFTLPAGQGMIDVLTLERSELEPRRWLAAARRGDADRLRDSFVHSPYDYVLINAPSLREQSDEETKAIFNSVATMCDAAVVCFSHRVATLRQADRIGRSLHRRAPGGIQVVPLRLSAGPGEDADTHFAELLADNPRPGGVLSVPDIAPSTPVLALFLDVPDVVPAYAALAAAVTFDAVTGLGELPAAVFARYRRATGFADAGSPPRFLVANTPADRLWADWITAHLRAAGAEVGTLRTNAAWLDESPAPELVVVGSDEAEATAEFQAAAARAATATQVIVDDAVPSLPGMATLRLAGLDPVVAAARLHGYFGLRPAAADDAPPLAVRHPAEAPDILHIPPAHNAHVGRADELERLRDRLLYGDGAPVRLTGAPGVGKTALAREYACRYANAYAVVWWISAHDRVSVLASIVALGRALREVTDEDVPGPLALLGSDLVGKRWLLVFDDGDLPEAYADLLPPPGRCHVLITTATGEDAGDFVVSPLPERDNAALLAGRLPQLTDTGKLHDLAAAVGYSPLAMELSAAWLTEVIRTDEVNPQLATAETRTVVDTFVARLGSPSAGPNAVARVLAVMSESLTVSESGRLTLLLAQFCALLSPEGVSLGLLRSKAVRRELIRVGGRDAVPLAVDAAEIDVLIAAGARIGLFRVDWGRTRTLIVHRVVRRALQDQLPAAFAPILREHVLRALANYAPTEQEEDQPTTMGRYAELNRHVMSTGAQDSADTDVRHWLVNQTRYLYRTFEPDVWEVALAPARQLYDRWLAAHTKTDPYVCMLAGQLANLYRALGQYDMALRLDSAALDMQRRHQGRAHYRSLLTARGLGADLRALGRLEDAMDEDIVTLDGLRAAFGEDHPQTLLAENNLAVSRFHAGDIATALAEGEAHCARRDRLFGPDDPHNWQALANLGVYQRAMGLFDRSVATFTRAHELASAMKPPPSQASPLVTWLRSISERLDPHRDTTMARGRNGEALVALRDLFGDEHLQVVACKLSYANAHRATGAAGHAVTAITECLDVLSRLPGITDAHPHPAVCRAMLAVALMADSRPSEALAPSDEGLRVLTEHLGPGHPLTLAAQVNHAVVLSAAGRHEQARTAAAGASRACADFLPGHHYYLDIASTNARQISAGDRSVGVRTLDLDISMP
ncbi:FxSxx-COOH system tetratricopeptide repeat protein [Actinophytocola sp.]|uniref:FxSxx-COOH system tetratricopeptide repeat protein n=1 Tax=Actinophytocola sp. TaxID=1872138 RepID=UPI002ED631C8